MRVFKHASVIVGAMLAVDACSKSSEKAAAPAKVQNPVAEAQLTNVVLTPDAVRRLAIKTAPVESLSVEATRTVGGEVVVPPGLSITVTSPVAGTVLTPPGGALPIAGARVARGSTLLVLAALPPDLAQAERDNDVAAARLRQAEAEAERTARLFAERLVAARDNERALADLASAKATAASAAAQLRLVRGGGAGGGLSTLRVTAPSDGVIRSLSVATGQTVAAGAPLAEVMRMDRLWVRVPIYAGDANRIRRNAAATVHGLSGALDGPIIVANPVAAPPSADAAASSVDLFYELTGSTLLRPGERVGVTLRMTGDGGSARGLTVPLAALLRDLSGGSWVYERLDSTTFARRRVDVARVVGNVAVLSLGPKVGTPVVTDGAVELFGTEFGAGK